MIPKNTLKAQLIIYRCLQDTISDTLVYFLKIAENRSERITCKSNLVITFAANFFLILIVIKKEAPGTGFYIISPMRRIDYSCSRFFPY